MYVACGMMSGSHSAKQGKRRCAVVGIACRPGRGKFGALAWRRLVAVAGMPVPVVSVGMLIWSKVIGWRRGWAGMVSARS
jgi:hypothetical protein